MWLNLVIAFFIGGGMGLLGHAKKLGKIEKPRITKKFIYLGFLEEVFIGIVAAVLIVLSAEIKSRYHVIFLSIIAGFGGDAVIQKFELIFHSQNKKETTNEQEINHTNESN